AIRMMQRGGDLVLAKAGAVVAVDQQGHAAAAVHMARPAERLIERGKLLEQELVLLQRRDRFRAARTDVNAIAHKVPPFESTKGAQGVSAPSSRHFQYSERMGRSCGMRYAH